MARLALLTALLSWLLSCLAETSSPSGDDAWTLDHRYAPPSWQTAICLPDDWQKTLVAKDGGLLYDYPGRFSGFATKITAGAAGEVAWVKQELVSPRIPITRTFKKAGTTEIIEESFAVAPPRPAPKRKADQKAAGDSGRETPVQRAPRHDILLARFRNYRALPAGVIPTITIQSESLITTVPDKRQVRIGAQTTLFCPRAWEGAERTDNGLVLQFPALTVPSDSERVEAFGVGRGEDVPEFPASVTEALSARKKAESYWRSRDLPYDSILVPDSAVQAQLDSCIRNIYQAREIKNGLPAFQVGPTCYRGLWVVDGSFLLEAMTYLGRTNECRGGVKYLMSFQREDGSFMLIDGHYKETGIALWALVRHARLTGDTAWLRDVWPHIERGFAYILKMRQMPAANAPNAGLIPDGFSDGGLSGKLPEYTNVYWTLAGMRAAVEAALWLGFDTQAGEWRQHYEDFYQAFRRAASRDTRQDADGNRYVPIRMTGGGNVPPQKAQWAFLHAVFPGKVFAANDPLVQGAMAMLKSVERQGLVLDTGWLDKGIWTYFGSFYGHAWLWLGDGDKAARTLYAFGNHASPLLCWREEQMPVGKGDKVVGDMPHNWASAEFIRLVRHCLVLQRGTELHLFEGLPAKWLYPGATLRLRNILTDFGPITLELKVSASGTPATLTLAPPSRLQPERIVLHLDNWSGQTGTVDLPAAGPSRRQFKLAVQ